jgi:hypothetical protein
MSKYSCKINFDKDNAGVMFVYDLNENEVHESQTEKVQKVPHGHHVQWTDQLTVINIRAHEPRTVTSLLFHYQL